MKHAYWLHDALSRHLVESSHVRLLQEPLSDTDILELQDKFLSNGVQPLKVKNIAQGRSIVEKFLQTLNIYHDVACLTVSDLPFSAPTTNMHDELLKGGYLDPLEPQYLEEFFIEHFYFDFLWIEATEDLLSSKWFSDVEKKIFSYKINQHIPIIVLLV